MPNFQLPGELPVARVVRGDRHDGAGAVGGEDVVGDVDRDLGVVHGVHAREALELHAGLVLGHLRALEVGLARGGVLVGADLVRVRDQPGLEPLLHERVLGAHHHVGRAEERVAAGGVDDHGVLRRAGGGPGAEGDLRAGGLADPVALHLLDALGPVDRVDVLEEALGVGGDPEHPLAHRAADHRVVAALGAAVDHLLVGEDGAEGGAPVHGHLGDVGEALLVELLEDPLRPLVVLRVAGADLAVPVVGEAERLDLARERRDVLVGRDLGVRARLDRVLLGGEAERVEAHRVQDVEALRALVAAEDVRGGVALGVADVQAGAGGVREHVQRVELGLRGEVDRGEGLLLLPAGLPLLFDFGEVVVGGAHGGPPRARGRWP